MGKAAVGQVRTQSREIDHAEENVAVSPQENEIARLDVRGGPTPPALSRCLPADGRGRRERRQEVTARLGCRLASGDEEDQRAE